MLIRDFILVDASDWDIWLLRYLGPWCVEDVETKKRLELLRKERDLQEVEK